jgi:hypothetical protein
MNFRIFKTLENAIEIINQLRLENSLLRAEKKRYTIFFNYKH